MGVVNDMQRYWLSYNDGRWEIVDVTHVHHETHLPRFGVSFYILRIDLPADDPRHFQIGCVITPRAIIGV